MRELERKRKIKRIFFSPWTIVLLFILVIFMFKVAFSANKMRQASEGMVNMSLEKESKMIERREFLEKEIDFLSTEKGVESEIRRKFRVVKEGEGLIIIVDKDDN